MPAGNPDLTEYVDLRLLDKDPQDFVDTALADAPAKVPGLLIPVASQERVYLELQALPMAELAATINRYVGATVEAIHGGLFRVPRDLGAPPVAGLEFVMADELEHEVPVGTRVRVDLGAGLEPLVFTTDEAVIAGAGVGFAVVSSTGDRNTDDANGIPAGTLVELLDAVPFVERVELATPVAGGADVEDDVAWFTRAQQRVDRLNETLTQPHQFTAFAYERPDVTRATTINNYDPGQAGAPGDHEGHITTAVYGIAGVLPAPAKAELEADLDAASYAPLIPHVVDPTITGVPIALELELLPGHDPATVAAAALDDLDAYLDPEVWDWSGTVYANEVIALVDRTVGVRRVVTVAITGANVDGDLVLAGVAPLADLDRPGSAVTFV